MMDIEKMTAEELTREIAKATGWRVMNWTNHHTYAVYRDMDTGPICDTEDEAWKTLDQLAPAWTTSIPAAFGLVDEMIASPETAFTLEYDQFNEDPEAPPDFHWGALISIYATDERDHESIWYEADTAPLAISRAYLMWKQGEDK